MLRYAVISLALCGFVSAQKIDPARIDSVSEAVRKQTTVPGLAVGIITRDGVYIKGYGVRNLQTKQPVTEHTAFDTGSVTKSFTALGAALLVDQGKLNWDKPVREYLPWFRMYDPAASELMTMRDLLTHRSGLPRYDLIRFAVPLSREELVRRLRYLPPSASFRERYQYQNLMYTAAGYLAGVIDGTSWEDLTEKRIFAPLGMQDSTTRVTDLQRTADFASPHEREDGVLKPVPFYDYQQFGVGPNGAVNSSAADLVRYLQFHMSNGTVDGKRILSATQLAELHRPQMVINETTSYALGWNVDWSLGFKVVSHGGSITGFNAYLAFAPERGEGIVVLTNSSGQANAVARALQRNILGWKLSEWGGMAFDTERRTFPEGPPSRPLPAYSGRYTHPAFGACEITESGGQLTGKFPALTFKLKHERFNWFSMSDGTLVQFTLGPDGEVSGADFRIEPSAPDLRFTRLGGTVQ